MIYMEFNLNLTGINWHIGIIEIRKFDKGKKKTVLSCPDARARQCTLP